jgi:hypothetical protein
MRVLFFAVAFASACMMMGDGLPPRPDDCVTDAAEMTRLDVLELGAPDERVFMPWSDGAVAPVVTGPQGGAMIGLRLRIGGPSMPACLPHQTTAANKGDGELARVSQPIKTYAEPDGSRVTKTLWLIFSARAPRSGERMVVSTIAGGLTRSVSLSIE